MGRDEAKEIVIRICNSSDANIAVGTASNIS